MEDREYQELYNSLITVLQKKRLNWVINEIDEQIRIGKLEEKEAKPLKERKLLEQNALPGFQQDTSLFEYGSKTKFQVRREYKPQERLLILINAIEQAVINIVEIENEVMAFFDTDPGLGKIDVTFTPTENEEEYTFTINSIDKMPKNSDVDKLKGLLTRLRKEVTKSGS